MAKKTGVIANQVFIGLPWKNVRPRYDKCIDRLEKKYPLHFTIVGRKDAQDAEDLLVVIKDRIDTSSYGIFDATSGNANVSLEYGYAEAIGIQRAIYFSTHKAARSTTGGAIISDLGGKRRIDYTNEASLLKHLELSCKNHDYTKRFEKFLARRFKSRKRGEKRSARALALKTIHYLDGKATVRREDLLQSLLAEGYTTIQSNDMIKRLHQEGLLAVSRGRFSDVHVA